jgi:hypothetical protein
LSRTSSVHSTTLASTTGQIWSRSNGSAVVTTSMR